MRVAPHSTRLGLQSPKEGLVLMWFLYVVKGVAVSVQVCSLSRPHFIEQERHMVQYMLPLKGLSTELGCFMNPVPYIRMHFPSNNPYSAMLLIIDLYMHSGANTITFSSTTGSFFRRIVIIGAYSAKTGVQPISRRTSPEKQKTGTNRKIKELSQAMPRCHSLQTPPREELG